MDRRLVAVLGIAAVLVAVVVAVQLLEDDAAREAASVPAPAARDVAPMTPPAGSDDALPDAPAADVESLAAAPAEVEPPPEPALVLEGTVVDPTGAPIEGATVAWIPSAAEGERPPERELVTPADGSFRLEFDALPTEGRSLSADAPGHVWIAFGGGTNWETTTGWTIELGWAVPVSGVVRDAETGAPVAGAEVWVSEERRTVTAADGSYRLEEIPVDWEVALRAAHPDYVERTVEFLLGENAPARQDVELVRGVPVELVAVDRSTGVPLPGAAFRRWRRSEPFAVADGAGRVVVRFDPGASRRMTVTEEDHLPLDWSWDAHEVTPGTSVRLPMSGLAWVEARVVDESGAPIDDARVWVETLEHTFGRRAVPEDAVAAHGTPGSLRDDERDDALERLAPGEFRVATRPTDEPLRVRASASGHVGEEVSPLELREPGDRVRVELRLRRAGGLAGRVTLNGAPPGTLMAWLRDADGAVVATRLVHGDGDYELTSLPAGTFTFSLAAMGSDEERYTAPVDVVAGEVTRHDVDLEEERGSIAGRVEFTDGTAAADRLVFARDADRRTRRGDSTRTDDDGRFVLEVAPDALYDVTVDHPVPETVAGVSVGTEDLLVVLARTHEMRLALVDAATGEPLRVEDPHDWQPWLHWRPAGDASWRAAQAPIDVKGRARLTVPVGRVDLEVDLRDEGWQPSRRLGVVVAEGDERPVRVPLERGSELELRLVEAATGEGARPDGHQLFVVPEALRTSVRGPAPGESAGTLNGVRVVLDDPAVRGGWVRPDERGAVTVRGLAPGRHAAVLLPADLELSPAVFTVPAPDGEPVVLRWGPPPGG